MFSNGIYSDELVKKNGKSDIGILIVFIHYWLVSNFFNFSNAGAEMIFIFVQLPIILLVIIRFRYFQLKHINSSNSYFIIFIVLVILVDLFKGQYALIMSTAVDVLPTYLILTNKRTHMPLKLINKVFIIQIAIAIAAYYLSVNPYGFIPGQSTVGEFAWKVSLFSYLTPPYTGAFAFLVFLMNAETSEKINWLNILIIVLTLYFMLFSGSRTIYIICGFYFLFTVFKRFMPMEKRKFFYAILPVVFLLLLIASASMGYLVKSTHNEFLDSFFFRNIQYDSYKSVEDLDRYIMWKQYLEIFSKNWLLGAGMIDKSKYFADTVGSGETLLAMMLAFHGILYFLFLAGIFKLLIISIERKLGMAYVGVVSFLIMCTFYGSYMKGYGMIWLLFFIMIASEFNKNNYARKRMDIYN